METDIFWKRIREFRDLFDGGVDIQNLRSRLQNYEESMNEIHDIWIALLLFTGLTLLLMLMLLLAILRYHLRLFQGERVVGRLV